MQKTKNRKNGSATRDRQQKENSTETKEKKRAVLSHPKPGDCVVSANGSCTMMCRVLNSLGETDKNTPYGYRCVVLDTVAVPGAQKQNVPCVGDEVCVQKTSVVNFVSEDVSGYRPDIKIIVRNGRIAWMSRTDGGNEPIVAVVVDEDDDRSYVYSLNAHSFKELE